MTSDGIFFTVLGYVVMGTIIAGACSNNKKLSAEEIVSLGFIWPVVLLVSSIKGIIKLINQ